MKKQGMAIWMLATFLTLSQAGAETPIDIFDYPDTTAVRADWMTLYGQENPTDYEETGPEPNGIRQLATPSGSNTSVMPSYNWSVTQDMHAFYRFEMLIKVENPVAIESISLLFSPADSGVVWMEAQNFDIREGWQTLHFHRANFSYGGGTEIADWAAIRRIRLKIKQGSDTSQPAYVTFARLVADNPEIAVVRGDIFPAGTYEPSIDRYLYPVARALDARGIAYALINDSHVEFGALPDFRLAVFPFNLGYGDENLKTTITAQVTGFVDGGGKVIALRNSVYDVWRDNLQIDAIGWTGDDALGSQFVEGNPLPANPDFLENITDQRARAGASHAETQVLSYWVNTDGALSSDPAWLLNTNGAFCGNSMKENNPESNANLMAGLVSVLLEDRDTSISLSAIESIGRMGYTFIDFDSTTETLSSDGAAADQTALVNDWLTTAINAQAAAESGSSLGDILKETATARNALAEAYYYSRENNLPEEEWLVWAYPEPPLGLTWDETALLLHNNGFSKVFMYTHSATEAHYDSDYLPESAEYAAHGDLLAQAVAACHKYGLELHVWRTNWIFDGATSSGWNQSLHDEGRTTDDYWGNPQNQLDPSDPRNRQLEMNCMMEVVEKYNIDGIHYDYIRYQNDNAGFNPEAIERFRVYAGLGATPSNSELRDGVYAEQWANWRTMQITTFVTSTTEAARNLDPEIQVSAAVFSDQDYALSGVNQDWLGWAQAGIVDFLMPMDYSTTLRMFDDDVREQISLLPEGFPLYPGIWYLNEGRVHDMEFMEQADMIRKKYNTPSQQPVSGFALFVLTDDSASSLIPNLGKAMTKVESWKMPVAAGTEIWQNF